MGRDDWFRNTSWSKDIEAAFFARLARARDKHQYLRIQAHTLALSHPQVALQLLDEYFKLEGNFDHAQAQVDRACAHVALGNIEDAIRSLEASLAREDVRPNVL